MINRNPEKETDRLSVDEERLPRVGRIARRRQGVLLLVLYPMALPFVIHAIAENGMASICE
jgi:hypothetical protein